MAKWVALGYKSKHEWPTLESSKETFPPVLCTVGQTYVRSHSALNVLPTFISIHTCHCRNWGLC